MPRSPRYPTYALQPVSQRSPLVNAWPFDADRPLHQIGIHSHQFLSVLLFEHGTGWYRLGERTIAVYPGTIILVPPDELHSWDAVHDLTGWLLFFMIDALYPTRSRTTPAFWWHDPLLAAFNREAPHAGTSFVVAADELPMWSARIRALHTEVLREQTGFVEAASAHLRLLLVDLMRLAQQQAQHHQPRAQPRLHAVFSYIEQSYMQPISLTDVAAAVGLTPGHLTTLVREHTGRTVLQWLQERRMTAARRLLVETDETVEQIAAHVGYVDVAYFIRLFRRAHGLPPLAWRKTAR